MSVEEELKKDHAEMQAAVDSKQKIIDAQVSAKGCCSFQGGFANTQVPLQQCQPMVTACG